MHFTFTVLDTLTHIVLGACIGEVVAGRQLGRKALVLGALAQNIPDIDFIASFWLPTAQDLMAHRGFTHSLLFLALVSPMLAWVSARLSPRAKSLLYRQWLFFWALQIFVHLFIDSFNAYGTGLFVPFSNYRVSFNTLFVADPLFSIWPALGCIVLFAARPAWKKRKAWAWASLCMSAVYLLVAIGIKWDVSRAVKRNMEEKKIGPGRYFTTPTPLNVMLWYIVADADSGYFTGYRSIFDSKDNIDFRYVCKCDSLLRPNERDNDVLLLKRFSRGYYSAEMWHDTLVFNDLCFGEMTGWGTPSPKFAFHYYVQQPDNNKLVVQRGRFAKWDMQTLQTFLSRIAGH